MEREYARDYVDGEEIPPLVIDADGVLPDGHRGSIHVERAAVRLTGEHQGGMWLWNGASLELGGRHQGSLHLEEGSKVVIEGNQQGSTHVGGGCSARVTGGRSQGSVHVARGGEFVVEVGGAHQGSVHNDGRYVLRGVRGGSYEGSGEYVEEAGSVVKRPIIRDGIAVHEW
ncbi:MAG TPA: hypothetical protein VJ398_08045 [Acidimicrobiia bacterium]|nr:hypothetical protein [Acidimicrobiia bacterium]